MESLFGDDWRITKSFVNCDGTLDNYTEPAILEKEYAFQVVWRFDHKWAKSFR